MQCTRTDPEDNNALMRVAYAPGGAATRSSMHKRSSFKRALSLYNDLARAAMSEHHVDTNIDTVDFDFAPIAFNVYGAPAPDARDTI